MRKDRQMDWDLRNSILPNTPKDSWIILKSKKTGKPYADKTVVNSSAKRLWINHCGEYLVTLANIKLWIGQDDLTACYVFNRAEWLYEEYGSLSMEERKKTFENLKEQLHSNVP